MDSLPVRSPLPAATTFKDWSRICGDVAPPIPGKWIDTDSTYNGNPSFDDFRPFDPGSRSGVALCLSGGGYRAALFHLGALRRLNETGILSGVSIFSCVSGGSILGGFLADRIAKLDAWPARGGTYERWDEDIAEPFRKRMGTDIRTIPLIKRYLLPTNWQDFDASVEALETQYQRHLTDVTLGQLPTHPWFIFCATDMKNGVPFFFFRGTVGHNYSHPGLPRPDWPLARAVAASSCFPPVFGPLPLNIGPLPGEPPEVVEYLRDVHLTDGGNYDNTGVAAVWKRAAYLLISDGGGRFKAEWKRSRWAAMPTLEEIFWRVSRYPSVSMKAGAELHARWLSLMFDDGTLCGDMWTIADTTGPGVGQPWGAWPAYPANLVEQIISRVRTDLDRFSEEEIAILENHGYFCADTAIERVLASGALPFARSAPFAPPHQEPQYFDPQYVAGAMAQSSQINKLSAGMWDAVRDTARTSAKEGWKKVAGRVRSVLG
jgi:NTE family protein